MYLYPLEVHNIFHYVPLPPPPIHTALCSEQFRNQQCRIITINVPVVFMARYVVVLRGATSLRGALEGVGPENRDFFGP
jgi:hypothetical protein